MVLRLTQRPAEIAYSHYFNDRMRVSSAAGAATEAAAGLDRLKDCERAVEIGIAQNRSLDKLRGATQLLKASNDAGEKELREEVEPRIHEYELKLVRASTRMKALSERVRGLKHRVLLANRVWQEHALRQAEK